MTTYTPEQLELYLEHIKIRKRLRTTNESLLPTLATLIQLQQHHIARVPFDSIGLHYSPTRLLSLDPEDLFQKIVVKSRGGYCMEVNALFGNILKSLGYSITNVGGRVKHTKWSHMVNIVSIEGQKFLVDVGFGGKEPTQPVLMQDGHEFTILGATQGRLDFKHIQKHSATAKQDQMQRLWVYSVRTSTDQPWQDMYSFAETEFFPEDFEMMNYFVSTRRDSWFVQEVVAYRLLMDENKGTLIGEVTLRGDLLTIRHTGEPELVLRMGGEEERVIALERHFDIKLTEREQRSIKGLVSEIKQRD
ncbi:unnamed protein product [Discula destructiva]